MPPEQLEEALKVRVTNLLEKSGIGSIANSQQELVLEVQVATSVAKDKTTALVLSLELREPAVLTREWAPGSSEELVVTSWREVLLGVTGSEDAIDKLFELADLGATRFAEEVRQARNRQ
jgi:hypothetical protein